MAKHNPEERLNELKDEDKRPHKALELEKLRSKAYGTMIDVAEETFNILFRAPSPKLPPPFLTKNIIFA